MRGSILLFTPVLRQAPAGRDVAAGTRPAEHEGLNHEYPSHCTRYGSSKYVSLQIVEFSAAVTKHKLVSKLVYNYLKQQKEWHMNINRCLLINIDTWSELHI